MGGKSQSDLTGPVSEEALDRFTTYLTELCNQTMELDPDSFGHEIFQEHSARYQWKIKGGRSSDHQGVALNIGMNREVYFIVHNQIQVIVRIRDEADVDAALLNDANSVLAPEFKAVLTDLMTPYERA